MLETYKNKHLGKTHLGSFIELFMISQLGCFGFLLLNFRIWQKYIYDKGMKKTFILSH